MLNSVAFIAIDQMMRGPLQSRTNKFTPQTDQIAAVARIQPLVEGTQISWAIVAALIVTVVVIACVQRSVLGLRLRVIGLNLEAAKHSGIPVARYWLSTMAVSGALCGLAGGLVILGLRYYLAPGWAPSWGFQGIVIAFLAVSLPLLIPLWALLLGMIAAAGPALKGEASVPDAIVTVMQTLPVVVLYVLYRLGALVKHRRWVGATSGSSTDGPRA
jgi:simple sugar transport system permease protein